MIKKKNSTKKAAAKLVLKDSQMERAARLFQLLSEASRLRILKALQGGPLAVNELVEETGLTQANTSRHLSTLYHAGLLSREKDKTIVRYGIQDPIVYDLCKLVCERLEQAE